MVVNVDTVRRRTHHELQEKGDKSFDFAFFLPVQIQLLNFLLGTTYIILAAGTRDTSGRPS